MAILTYAITLGLLLAKRNGVDELALIVCIIMLAYVVMGIWLRSSFLGVIGLLVTVATLAGRIWIPAREFMLWMAVFGGGGLFLPGLYVKLRWR